MVTIFPTEHSLSRKLARCRWLVAGGIFVELQKVRRVALFYISANLYVLLNRKQLCSFICSYS